MTETMQAPATVFESRVDTDAAAAFALATNDANPRYQESRAVPPLYTAGLVLDALWEAQSLGVGSDDVSGWRLSVHGEHDLYFHRPVRPGMKLKYSGQTHSARHTKGGVLVAQRIAVTDFEGRLLLEHLWSSFYAGGTIDEEYGEPLPDHTFPGGAGDRPVGSRRVPVDRDQAYRYAGVSGDHAGHAMDDEIARSEGYPGKILQGMCTFGLACGPVVDLAAGGDPDRLTRLAVRFSAPARPLTDLEVRVYDAGPCGPAGRAYAFEAHQDGVAVLRHGRAEVRD